MTDLSRVNEALARISLRIDELPGEIVEEFLMDNAVVNLMNRVTTLEHVCGDLLVIARQAVAALIVFDTEEGAP